VSCERNADTSACGANWVASSSQPRFHTSSNQASVAHSRRDSPPCFHAARRQRQTQRHHRAQQPQPAGVGVRVELGDPRERKVAPQREGHHEHRCEHERHPQRGRHGGGDHGMNDRSGAPDRGAVRGGLERPGRGLFTAGILAEFAGFSKTVVGSQRQNP
jgi:hypothetical protein